MAVSSLNQAFKKSEKGHEKGEEILNALLKNDMIFFHNTPELSKIAKEFMTLRHATPKRHRKDDLVDTVRYQVCEIVWNFEAIVKRLAKSVPDPTINPPTKGEQHLEDRRNRPDFAFEMEQSRIEAEFSEFNDLYGSNAT